MANKNLWGDIVDLSNMRSPHEILVEQGKFLEEMTEGLLEIKIERKQSNTVFGYDVYIALPAMKYKERLLRMSHDIKLYPAILHDALESKQTDSKNQEEFEESLGSILSSPETMSLIASLMVQARSSEEPVV
jgi:hypothetical protein